MDTQECIHTRRSIRKYSEAEVEWDKIGQVVEAGNDAPSAGNIQDWKFVVVKDEGTRQAIAKACLDQYWMAQAPVHIVVCADPSNTERHYGIRGTRLYTIQNSAAAIQNMLLAAHSLGLGTCWVGAFEEELLRQSIGAPDSVRPQAVITLGYAIEKPKPPIKKEIYELVFLEGYGNRTSDIDRVLGYTSIRVYEAREKLKKTAKKATDKEKWKGLLNKAKKTFKRKDPEERKEDEWIP